MRAIPRLYGVAGGQTGGRGGRCILRPSVRTPVRPSKCGARCRQFTDSIRSTALLRYARLSLVDDHRRLGLGCASKMPSGRVGSRSTQVMNLRR